MTPLDTNTINLSETVIPEGILTRFVPEQGCFNWCAEQHITHSNNLEVWAVMFVAISYFFLLLAEWGNEIKFLRKYQNFFLYMAKVWLLIFFLIYFLFVVWKVF